MFERPWDCHSQLPRTSGDRGLWWISTQAKHDNKPLALRLSSVVSYCSCLQLWQTLVIHLGLCSRDLELSQRVLQNQEVIAMLTLPFMSQLSRQCGMCGQVLSYRFLGSCAQSPHLDPVPHTCALNPAFGSTGVRKPLPSPQQNLQPNLGALAKPLPISSLCCHCSHIHGALQAKGRILATRRHGRLDNHLGGAAPDLMSLVLIRALRACHCPLSIPVVRRLLGGTVSLSPCDNLNASLSQGLLPTRRMTSLPASPATAAPQPRVSRWASLPTPP